MKQKTTFTAEEIREELMEMLPKLILMATQIGTEDERREALDQVVHLFSGLWEKTGGPLPIGHDWDDYVEVILAEERGISQSEFV